MNLIQRLRALLGLSTVPEPNLVIDDLFQTFLERITHAEGNAVQVTVSAQVFTETNIGELLSADLIYGWSPDEAGNYVLYSDKERLSRFDLEALRQLEINGMAIPLDKPWWNIQ